MTSIYEFNGETKEGRKVEGGRIVSPGKFEGQMAYMEDAYDLYLNGFCDDNGTLIKVDVPQAWTHYDELRRRRTIAFVEDDQGFVREV